MVAALSHNKSSYHSISHAQFCTSQYFLENGQPLELIPVLPNDWNGMVLPGSQTSSYTGPLGQIVIQEYKHESWCIRYSAFRFLKKTVLQWKDDEVFRVQFALQGTFKYGFPGGKIRLKSGTSNTCWAPNRVNKITFAKGEKYIFFQVFYHPGMVQQLLPHFPNKPLPQESKITLTEKEWLHTIRQILDAPYDTETLRFYFENRVRDLLLFLLLRPGSGIRYAGVSSADVIKIHQIDAVILEDLKQWLHVPVLAKKVHMSEFKLKMAFKQVIGMNLFERLRVARLEKARQLLVETDLQIKVIFREIGYKSLSGFEEAFKERFKMGPSKYRKQFQPD